MKNIKWIKKTIFIILISSVVFSCSSKFSIQKRRYNKGFYIAKSQKQNKQTNTLSSTSKVNFSKQEKIVVTNETKSKVVSDVKNDVPVKSQSITKTIINEIKSGLSEKVITAKTIKTHFSNIKNIKYNSSYAQIGKAELKSNSQKRGILSKILRWVMVTVGLFIIGIAAVLYIFGAVTTSLSGSSAGATGDMMALAIVLFAVGAALIVLAFVMKVT